MNARDLFKRTEAVVEYRPVKRMDGGWDWYWALLPLPAEDCALASGMAVNRGEASLEARKEARKLGRRITRIRVHHHALKDGLTPPQSLSPQDTGAEPPLSPA